MDIMLDFINFLTEAKIDEDVRIVVLSGKSNENESGYFVTAGKIKDMCDKKGIKCFVAFAEQAFLKKDGDMTKIYNEEGKKGFEIDKNNTVFIVRNSVIRKKASIDLLSQIERRDMFCINNRDSMEICDDKYRTILKLADAGIPVPLTAVVPNEESIEVAMKKVGNKFPIIVKTLTGSKGLGVFIVDRIESLRSTLQAIWKINNNTEILFQEYIEASYDLRIHVLGHKVIAAMKRFKIKKDFRSNFSLGGKVSDVKLTDEQEKIAILAAKTVGAAWAGVDMMIDKEGKACIIEVNTSPGTEGIEKATGKSIIKMLLDYAMDKKHWLLKTTECGYLEMINIEVLGELIAKMDTGNGAYSVIHANKWDVKDGYVTWTHDGKEYEHKFVETKKVRMGGLKSEYEERPVIELNVTFNGTTYNDVKFTLSNRESMTTPVLMSRGFIKLANLSINPAKRYAITVRGGEKSKEVVKESIIKSVLEDY
jgi:RimK family alpha-L-glutamate ligase